jgi:predicted nucleic acid-binding protein
LAKCGGWEDTRSPEEIIADIYATQTVSNRGADFFPPEEFVSPMLHYLLDTDICIDLLNGNPHVKTRVSQEGIEALAIAIPTVGELYFGAYNSTRVEANVARVRAFLFPPGPPVLMIDEPAAEQFGRYKALLRLTAARPPSGIARLHSRCRSRCRCG